MGEVVQIQPSGPLPTLPTPWRDSALAARVGPARIWLIENVHLLAPLLSSISAQCFGDAQRVAAFLLTPGSNASEEFGNREGGPGEKTSGRCASVHRLIKAGLPKDAAERCAWIVMMLRSCAYRIPMLTASGVSGPKDLEELAAIQSGLICLLSRPGTPRLLALASAFDELGFQTLRIFGTKSKLFHPDDFDRATKAGMIDLVEKLCEAAPSTG
jgi:hypothetical protein